MENYSSGDRNHIFLLQNIPLETSHILLELYFYWNIHITLESKSVWNICCWNWNKLNNTSSDSHFSETYFHGKSFFRNVPILLGCSKWFQTNNFQTKYVLNTYGFKIIFANRLISNHIHVWLNWYFSVKIHHF